MAILTVEFVGDGEEWACKKLAQWLYDHLNIPFAGSKLDFSASDIDIDEEKPGAYLKIEINVP